MKKNKQINQSNSQGKAEGYWERYYSNGQLWYKGHYVNGYAEGYWEYYYVNGQLSFKGHYVKGEEIRGIDYERE